MPWMHCIESHLKGYVHRTFAGGWCGCDVFMQPSRIQTPVAHLPCCVLHFQPAHIMMLVMHCFALTSNDRDDLDFLNHCIRLTTFTSRLPVYRNQTLCSFFSKSSSEYSSLVHTEKDHHDVHSLWPSQPLSAERLQQCRPV